MGASSSPPPPAPHMLTALSLSDRTKAMPLWVSYWLGFLLARTVLLTLIMARIDSVSKKGLTAMFCCSADSYTIEVSIWALQMARGRPCRAFCVTLMSSP